MRIEKTGYKTLKQLEEELERLERFEKFCLNFGREDLYREVKLKTKSVREELFIKYSKEIEL